jgi:hypothetical protein
MFDVEDDCFEDWALGYSSATRLTMLVRKGFTVMEAAFYMFYNPYIYEFEIAAVANLRILYAMGFKPGGNDYYSQLYFATMERQSRVIVNVYQLRLSVSRFYEFFKTGSLHDLEDCYTLDVNCSILLEAFLKREIAIIHASLYRGIVPDLDPVRNLLMRESNVGVDYDKSSVVFALTEPYYIYSEYYQNLCQGDWFEVNAFLRFVLSLKDYEQDKCRYLQLRLFSPYTRYQQFIDGVYVSRIALLKFFLQLENYFLGDVGKGFVKRLVVKICEGVGVYDRSRFEGQKLVQILDFQDMGFDAFG